MAAVPIAISGVIWDKQEKKGKPVFLAGLSYNPALKVEGGPIIPEAPPEVGDPPIIWGGPIDPYPDHGLPGPQPPPDQKPPFEVKVGWTAETGWVVVLVPTGEHVTPSKK